MDSLNSEPGGPQPASSNSEPGCPQPVFHPPFDQHSRLGSAVAQTPAHPAKQWLITFRDSARVVLTALLLAFVFRAFFVEPFIIPTGSMAPGLLGDHWSFLCPVCGDEFDVNAADEWTEGPPPRVACANCRNWLESSTLAQHKRGDRIVVHKWPLDLWSPRRWDVIVFRDPVQPQQNYIKRVVGLPGERVEIRDGDVWINGAIAPKPAAVQQALWLPVFSQDLAPDSQRDPAPRWVEAGDHAVEAWSGLMSRVLRFHAPDAREHTLFFASDGIGEYRHDFSSHNTRSSGALLRDVRFSAELEWSGLEAIRFCEIELRVPPCTFRLRLVEGGAIHIELVDAVGISQKHSAQRSPPARNLEIAHVDGRFYASANGHQLWSLEADPSADSRHAASALEPAELRITGRGGGFSLHHVRVQRDTFYTHSRRTIRAADGEPFQLAEHEYFVLGDNSADSHDSREWDSAGPHLDSSYRPGTVRAREIVGQGALVYLPGVWEHGLAGSWWLPDVGRVRFIR